MKPLLGEVARLLVNVMEILSLYVIFPILLVLFVFSYTRKRFRPRILGSKLAPPGPWKLPLLGNIHQLATTPLVHHRLMELSSKYGPIMQLQLGEVPTVIISSPELAKEVMKTHDVIFANRPNIYAARVATYNWTDIAFSPYGDHWRQLRRNCTVQLLNAKRVQSFRSIREAEVSNLIADISSSAGRPINLSSKISTLAYGITARAAFGKKSKDQEAFIQVVKETTKLAGGFSISDFYPSLKFLPLITGLKHRCEKLGHELDRILENIINDRITRKTERESLGEEKTFVDVLLEIEEQGDLEIPFTRETIKAVLSDVFSAGSETSSTVVEWALSEMVKNPRIMKKAHEEVRQVCRGKGNVEESDMKELKYLKAIVKEALRLHHSAPLLLPRENREACEINGYEIPRKSRVVVNAWGIGRDPKQWKNGAETFYPERWFLESEEVQIGDYKGTNLEYIPFGAGRRICPGISFAIPNTELHLAQLIYHFDWEMGDGSMKAEDLDMTEAFGLTTRRKKDLYLKPNLPTYLPNGSSSSLIP